MLVFPVDFCYDHDMTLLEPKEFFATSTHGGDGFFFDGIGKEFLIQLASSIATTSIFFCWNHWIFFATAYVFSEMQSNF